MAKGKDYMSRLQKLAGAVVDDYNPHNDVIQTPSPSVNFTYGNGHGLPLGYTQVYFGPPKSGKTVLTNAAAGQVHKDYPDGWVLKFNTEFRERGQLTDDQKRVYGIDKNRYLAFEVNSPDLVFDVIEKEVAAELQDGMPLKLVIIDSITGIQGRRMMNSDTIMQQQIGDLALTLQDGFKRILPIQRKYNLAFMLTAHVRAEMDQWEQKRNGHAFRMAASLGVKHYAEYFTFVEEWKSKEGRTSLLGSALEDASVKDLKNKAERTGHKIRVTMVESSMGPKNRAGVFTLDYHKGIIHTYEEVFQLAVNRGVFDRPTTQKYAFGDKQWTGKAATLEALRDDPHLEKAVLMKVKELDQLGRFNHVNVEHDLDIDEI